MRHLARIHGHHSRVEACPLRGRSATAQTESPSTQGAQTGMVSGWCTGINGQYTTTVALPSSMYHDIFTTLTFSRTGLDAPRLSAGYVRHSGSETGCHHFRHMPAIP